MHALPTALFILSLLTNSSLFTLLEAKHPVLTLESENVQKVFPDHFRMTSEALPKNKSGKQPSTKGLDALQISGSGQFSHGGLTCIISKQGKKNGMIIDLRQEPHGFISGRAVSWHHIPDEVKKLRSFRDIERNELKLLKKLLQTKNISIKLGRQNERGQKKLVVTSTKSERELVESLGLKYVRFPVPDEAVPSISDINHFVSLVKEIPEGTWVHIHCTEGLGRTTMFLILYDMLKNAKQVNFDDIIARHRLLGGLDFSKVGSKNDHEDLHVKRMELVYDFYSYCLTNSDNYKTPFKPK